MHDTARLAQPVRLLGTDRDGEVLAAVAAMRRMLAAAGLDFHDLAAAAEQWWNGTPASPDQSAPPPWQLTAKECLTRGMGRLRPAEIDFLHSMTTWPHEPSAKHARWLDAISAALGIERAAA